MRKGDRTRDRIIQQAAPLFNQRGYVGSSMSDIMDATGLQKGGIYNHFSTKEELALQVFDFAVQQVGDRVTRAMEGKDHAVERLLAMITFFRSLVDDPPIPGGCPLLNMAIESDDAYPVLRDRVRMAMDRWRARIHGIVTEGMASGEIRSSADPDLVATVFIAALEGAVMLSKLYGDPVHMDRAAEFLADYAENNLGIV